MMSGKCDLLLSWKCDFFSIQLKEVLFAFTNIGCGSCHTCNCGNTYRIVSSWFAFDEFKVLFDKLNIYYKCVVVFYFILIR